VSISSTFYARIFRPYFGAKKFQTQKQPYNFCLKNFVQKMRAKTLMQLTEGCHLDLFEDLISKIWTI